MYHHTYCKACYDDCWHNVFKYRHTFLKSQESTQDGPANDAEGQDLILEFVGYSNPMEHEYQGEEPKDRSDEDDGRRVY